MSHGGVPTRQPMDQAMFEDLDAMSTFPHQVSRPFRGAGADDEPPGNKRAALLFHAPAAGCAPIAAGNGTRASHLAGALANVPVV
eukprot:128715-Pyramimonas_sp.AAC.1